MKSFFENNSVVDIIARVGEGAWVGINKVIEGIGYGFMKVLEWFSKGSSKVVQKNSDLMVRGRVVKCPKCRSVNVNHVGKGFSKSKGALGILAFGNLGFLLGRGRGKSQWHCGNCGKTFRK